MGKAGFDDDQLIDIASMRVDDLSTAPAAPIAGQIQLYVKGGKLCRKNSAGVEYCYEDLVVQAENKIRFTVALMNNGTLQDGQQITYSELLPNTEIVIPRASELTEITFSNNVALADAQFKIYKNSVSEANLLQTWNLTDVKSAYLAGLRHAFAAGDLVIVKYADTGTKPSDVSFVLFFQSL